MVTKLKIDGGISAHMKRVVSLNVTEPGGMVAEVGVNQPRQGS